MSIYSWREEFHSEEKSESAAVSSVAAIEEVFHDESRSITVKANQCREIQAWNLRLHIFIVYQHNDRHSHFVQHIVNLRPTEITPLTTYMNAQLQNSNICQVHMQQKDCDKRLLIGRALHEKAAF